VKRVYHRGAGQLGHLNEVVAKADVVLIGVIVALALAPPLSGPALEKIIALEEVELGAPPRENLGFWSEVWCGLRAQLFVWMLASPLLLLLWLVELFVPPAVVVTLPLKLAVTSFTLAWNLLDYPLTLRQVRMRDRWQLFARYKLACLGFGAALSLLFWVPCGCQVILPEGNAYILVDAATGVATDIDAVPVPSPDGSRFATASLDLIAGHDPNRFRIYRISPNGPVIEWSVEPKEWGPADPVWIDDSRIRFDRVTADRRTAPISFRRSAAVLEGGADGWSIVPSD
jgi:hypothetical protein